MPGGPNYVCQIVPYKKKKNNQILKPLLHIFLLDTKNT